MSGKGLRSSETDGMSLCCRGNRGEAYRHEEAPKPLGEGGPDLHYFLLGTNPFALMLWMVKPYSRRQLTREERIANYRISRGRRVLEQVQGTTGHHGAKPKGCQRLWVDVCAVA